jgi:hypothetical protein
MGVLLLAKYYGSEKIKDNTGYRCKIDALLNFLDLK